jgi:uncharacterized protein (TIGR02001 family)
MRKKLVAPVLLAIAIAPMAVEAQDAEVSGNAGWSSAYYYRGVLQKASSASAGVDLAAGSFSLGTWGADVGDGAEIDLYGAVGIDLADNASLSIGGTGYFYTGEFDNTYIEANFNLALGAISAEYSLGSHRVPSATNDYSFFAITAESSNGWYGTLGAYGTDYALAGLFGNGTYAEAGYGFSAADLDFVISGIFSDSDISGETSAWGGGRGEMTMTLGVSKTFDIPTG